MSLQLVDFYEGTEPSAASKLKARRRKYTARRGPFKSNPELRQGYHAYCTSARCNPLVEKMIDGVRKRLRYSTWCIKEVRKGTIDCPDCRSVLVWKDVK